MPRVVEPSGSPLQRHRGRWASCEECDLCNTRRKVVLCRGTIPCDILFIGEAPGPSEDAVGLPFVGPAGHLLDRVIEQAGLKDVPKAFTNLVCCIPRDEEGKKFAEPPDYSIQACHERLVEFVRICQPKAIILVGLLAKKAIYGEAMFSESGEGPCGWLDVDRFLEFGDIVHPAAILRADITKQELMARRAAVTLEEVARRIYA